jgi:hypothetical protein
VLVARKIVAAASKEMTAQTVFFRLLHLLVAALVVLVRG